MTTENDTVTGTYSTYGSKCGNSVTVYVTNFKGWGINICRLFALLQN